MPIVLALDAILHVLILATFLLVFFRLIIAPSEVQKMREEIKHSVNKFLPAALDAKYKENKSVLTTAILATPAIKTLLGVYAHPDGETVVYNRSVFIGPIVAIVGMLIVCVAIILVLHGTGKSIGFMNRILIENVILFTCVAGVEWLFFKRIASKWVPAPPSSLVRQISSSLLNNKEDDKKGKQDKVCDPTYTDVWPCAGASRTTWMWGILGVGGVLAISALWASEHWHRHGTSKIHPQPGA